MDSRLLRGNYLLPLLIDDADMEAQAKVCLERIETFLNEEEVTEQVSSLKHDRVDPTVVEDARLGIVHASFKWNEIEDETVLPSSSDTVSMDESVTDPSDSISVSNTEQRKFELRDIDVTFPEGRLTVVTGPSRYFTIIIVPTIPNSTLAASGKTALLVSHLSI